MRYVVLLWGKNKNLKDRGDIYAPNGKSKK